MALDVENRPDQGSWLLPLSGETIIRCLVDFAFTIEAANGVSVSIEQPFTYTRPDGVEQLISPAGDPVKLAPALAVARTSVVEALAYTDGRLEMALRDGSRIAVPISHDYEPWQVVGPAGLRMVSLPGGELAIWRPVV